MQSPVCWSHRVWPRVLRGAAGPLSVTWGVSRSTQDTAVNLTRWVRLTIDVGLGSFLYVAVLSEMEHLTFPYTNSSFQVRDTETPHWMISHFRLRGTELNRLYSIPALAIASDHTIIAINLKLLCIQFSGPVMEELGQLCLCMWSCRNYKQSAVLAGSQGSTFKVLLCSL